MRCVRWTLAAALLLVMLALAGCGGGGNATTPTPRGDSGSPTATPKTIFISAHNNLFDRDEITVSAGAPVSIEFMNLDAVPHNISVYSSPAAEDELFVGETFTGPERSRTYQLTAPEESGTYFFRCDVHPVTMTGNFVVE